MPAPRGNKKEDENLTRRGAGRPKGSVNKTTAAVKDMIIQALSDAHKDGGAAYLRQQAKDNPTAFMTLVGKVLPLQLTGAEGGPIQTEDVSFRDAPDEVVRWLAAQRPTDQSTHH